MTSKHPSLIALSGALIFTLLFYKQSVGINLFLFESILLLWLLLTERESFREPNFRLTAAGLFVSAVFSVVTFSRFAITVNILALLVFTGLMIYPQARSLLTSLQLSLANAFRSQGQFLKSIRYLRVRNVRFGAYIWRFRIYLLPILIILLFITIYRLSNPVFNNIFSDLGEWINQGMEWIVSHINIALFWTFVLGLIISNTLFIRTSDPVLAFRDASSPDKLIRTRRRSRSEFRNLDLRNEFRAALFLLIALNILLLILNVADIRWVWFNFEWEGQYLKSYVHEGAYLLILSILISIALVLWIFRRNLNFIRNSAWLRNLSYVWLAQNAVLTLSVAIRNYHYIKHFALAYGRIGVYIFIILTLFGLISVFFKIRRNMSTFYIFRVNAYAWYTLLLITSFVNWDLVIAQYNFSHADRAFLHLDFMSKLSDKTLPYLDKSLEELNRHDSLQKEEFPFRHKYMSPGDYVEYMDVRREEFIDSWEQKGILSWNLPEQIAYNKLKNKSLDTEGTE